MSYMEPDVYLETAGSLRMIRLQPGDDPVEVAERHRDAHPTDTRFRLTYVTRFSVPEKGKAPVCGATQTYPEDPEELARQGLPVTWAGVTVTCQAPPHQCAPDAVEHSGQVIVNGTVRALTSWGPGWLPTGA
ncbi:hypothetical protein [Streptomyces misionensis]|uniref:hypothetical protein n=1 Tax=Streptomyces misionensis TaxID=67331 RepID=UPI00142DCCC7|nr:hypothetical protein [Streptomyces misionensis]